MATLTQWHIFTHGVEFLRMPSSIHKLSYDPTLAFYMSVIYKNFAEDPESLTEEMKEKMLDIAVLHFAILLDSESTKSYENMSDDEKQACRERIRARTYEQAYHGADESDANIDESAYDLWQLAEVYMKKILQMFTC